MSKARELAALGNAYSDGALSNRNVLINGGFTVSQRGDYTTATAYTGGSYYLDRWSMWLGGVSATMQHTTVTIGGVAKRAMRIVATSTASGYIGARQVIELQNLQVGATYTASALVRSNNSNVRFRQNAFQGQNADGPTFTNDGNWERVTWTFETSGTGSNPAIGIIAYNNGNVSINSGDYIEFTDVQLEVGDTATPFEHRSYGQELALCQRYFFKYDFPATSPFGPAHHQTSNTIRAVVHTPQPMRVTPSINASGQPTWFTYYNNGASSMTVTTGNAWSVVSGSLDNNRITIQATQSGLSGVIAGLFGYSGDFIFDAEL